MRKFFVLFGVLLLVTILPDTASAQEQVYLDTDFSDGAIDPMWYWGSGDYIVFDTSSDPLGTGEWGVEVWNSPTEDSRGVMTYRTDEKLEYVRIKETIAMADISKWQQLILVTSMDIYGTGNQLAWLEKYDVNSFRIRYLDNGAITRTVIDGITAENNRKYEVELIFRIGDGDGELHIAFDGVPYMNLTGLNNDGLGLMDAFEFGTSWSGPGVIEYIYDVYMSGDIADIMTVTGRTVDESNGPIAGAGIRVGSPPPINQPWLTNTYHTNIYTDDNGNFSFEILRSTIPEIKIIARGYGDPSEPVGSITRLKDVDLTQTIGNAHDLGDIVLQSRPAIQASPLPNSTFWPFRSVMIFPYTYRYTSQGYIDNLDTLRSRLGNGFNVIDARLPTGNNASGLPVHDDAEHDGLYTYEEVGAQIDRAHERGFKVILSRWYPAGDQTIPGWMDAYKEVILEGAAFAADHQVEYFCLGFEIKYCDDPENNWECLDLLLAAKAYADSRPDWNPKIVYIGVENDVDLTKMKQLWWLRHPYLDIVGVEDWRRKAADFDPTREQVANNWRYGVQWENGGWEWQPEPPDRAQLFREFVQWVKKPVILNFGAGTGDGTSWAPYISGYRPNVQDQEELATFYAGYFDALQDLPLYGVLMEHYSFAPSNTTINGCFKATLAEDFIKSGLEPHSQWRRRLYGRFRDKFGEPVNATVFAFNEGTDVAADRAEANSNGTYDLELTPAAYDIQFNITDFFKANFFIKLLSVNPTTSLENILNHLTQYPAENRLSFTLDKGQASTIQVHSVENPMDIKVNGTSANYDDTLSTAPSWSYDDMSKTITIKLE
jgi:hypothetical protein